MFVFFSAEIVVVISLSIIATGQGPSLISIPPESYNASLGTVVNFTCVGVDGVIAVGWRVTGANQSTYTFTAEVNVGILWVEAIEENDGAEVACEVFRSGGATDRSEPAVLRVQGLLTPPLNLMVTNMDADAITLTWDPPPTIDLTDIHPDISHYTVYIELNSSHVWSETVTETEYTFTGLPGETEVNPCHVYQFSVSAWNVVGEGEQSDPVEGHSSTALDIHLDGRGGSLKVTCNLSSCPTGCRVMVVGEDGSLMQMDTTNNDHLLTASVTFSGLTNGTYMVTVSSIDADGHFATSHQPVSQFYTVTDAPPPPPSFTTTSAAHPPPTNDPSAGDCEEDPLIGAIAGIVGTLLLATAAVSAVVIISVVCVNHKSNNKSEVTMASIELRENASYETVVTQQQREKHITIGQMEPCPAYDIAIPRRQN